MAEERYQKYIGENQIAKVEEHPFRDGMLACMLLHGSELRGRRLTPDQARELADSLHEAANIIEHSD